MKTVCAKIAKFCLAKGVNATPERIELNARMLLDRYSEKEIAIALGRLFWKTSFFPDASLIAKELEANERDSAVEMAGAICDAISSFGEQQAPEARRHLGEVAWHAVERFGGWSSLSAVKNSELPTVRAQLRELCQVTVKATSRIVKDNLLPYQKASARVGQLQKMNFQLLEGGNGRS